MEWNSDIKTAYDIVDHFILTGALLIKGIPPYLVAVIYYLISDRTITLCPHDNNLLILCKRNTSRQSMQRNLI